jgi:aminoglycoside phosphotransferase (APT) family kinase protein
MSQEKKVFSTGIPPSDVKIDEKLIYNLIEQQFPELSGLKAVFVDEGWDNAIYKLGEQYCLRLPRRHAAVELILNEQKYLPLLKTQLTIPAPYPIKTGSPSDLFPYPWSVLPWFEGECADINPLGKNHIKIFSSFLKNLHKPAPKNAPFNASRGVKLEDRAQYIQKRIDSLSKKTDILKREIVKVWETGLCANYSADNVWLHGDLHAKNVLVSEREVSAIIDWGDITSGDPATDLASVWTLFESRDDRDKLLESYGLDQDTYNRARSWAFSFGVVLLDTGRLFSKRHENMGLNTIMRLLEDLD